MRVTAPGQRTSASSLASSVQPSSLTHSIPGTSTRRGFPALFAQQQQTVVKVGHLQLGHELLLSPELPVGEFGKLLFE